MAEAAQNLVSVVVPTFNRRSLLKAVVGPLLDDEATGEVIVVVDGSRDGSRDMLEEWSTREPRIRTIFQENSGEAAARWRGVTQARFPVILIIDDDVVAEAGLVSGHASYHADGARRLVLGYMPTRLPKRRRRGQVPAILYAQDYERTCLGYERDPASIFTQFWAGNLSLRLADVQVVRPVGGPPLPYHEDKKLGLRCRDAGLQAVFDRSLLASHTYNRDLKRFLSECRRVARGRALLIAQYPALREELDPTTALSPLAAAIARGLSAPVVCRVAEPALAALSDLAGRAGVWTVESFCVRVLRQIVIFSTYRQEVGSSSSSDRATRSA